MRSGRCGRGWRILEAIAELNEADPELELQVRVGINTGEAVVALGARPEQGEGIVTGDVVNTAARIQSAAPVGGVAVGEQTYRATSRVFEYEPLEPASVKGKAEPLSLWRAKAARSRFGTDITRRYTTPLVGRELEKPLLIGTFERAAQQRSVQLVTMVGEPGVGKSRLVAELFAYLGTKPELTRWRQGRCLPYGEGITFWALGEIVKAEAGILESDSAEVAAAKLDAAVSPEEPERQWLLQRLAPLVGVEAASPAERQELFTAWRRYLEGLAAARPSVLVFEDLHWADEALLAFLEHLAEWAEGVPLLLLCTARPELYERHPGWAAGIRNATTINLPPLSDRGDGRARFPSDHDQRAQRGAGAARAGAGGRQPALRGGVRAPARRPRPGCRRDGVAGESAGADRRPPGHALAGAEEPASGRGRAREGVLGGRAGRDRRPRPGRARAGAARARP